MIIEGIITTENTDGTMHVAPIGPHVDVHLQDWTLKPFQTSTTFQNLHRTGLGVFHVSDDALLMATSVLGIHEFTQNEPWATGWLAKWKPLVIASRESKYQPELGWILQKSHRYFALKMDVWDLSEPRAVVQCSVLEHNILLPFWGWNRAKHSVLELSVLASRRHLIPKEEIALELDRHRILIEKTAGESERAALELLSLAMSR